MSRNVRFLCLFAVFTLTTCPTYGQVQAGTPAFGSFGGGPDVINLGNLNAALRISGLNKPGRGLSAQTEFTFNTWIWVPVTLGSTTSWQQVSNWGLDATQPFLGYLTNTSTQTGCSGGAYVTITNFAFHDPFGTSHPFSGYVIIPIASGCGQVEHDLTSLASDGSGLTLNYSQTIHTIVDRNGDVTVVSNSQTSGGQKTDRNGNFLSYNFSTGVMTDTLGQSVFTLAGASPNPVTVSYTSPAGTTANYAVSFKSYTVKTNFGCSVSEYGPINNSLPDRVTLPDGTFYQFSYEATPGFSGDITGRLAAITLPTGGSITYTYTGGSSGHITCANGSAAGLQRVLSDGASWSATWNYVRTPGTGAAYTTKATDPQGNDTVIQFQGIYETQRQVYQGSSTSGTLLETTNTCYNGSSSPCTGTAITLPIVRRTQIIQLPDTTGKQSKHDSFYNSYGLITEVDDYDYGSGAVGSLIRKTLTTFATLGNGIVAQPASVIVQDSGGATKSKTTYAYDETAVTATTGTPQLAAVSGSRGNVTSVKTYKDATNFLTSTMSYFDTGTVKTSTEANGAQTTYNFADATSTCGNAFPTSVSEPLNMSRNMTWNCTGGVLTSVTDENGKQTSTNYSDQYFWRPASISDPASAATNLTYTGQTSIESSLSFNSGNSAVDVLTILDGLGRDRLKQTRQSPGAMNFDSIEQDYDSLGRLSRSTLPYNGTAGQLNSTGPAISKTYDALGRPLTVTDAGGESTTYLYTKNDVLVTASPAPTGENAKRRQMEYDALGRLTSVCEITAGYTGAPAGNCAQTVSQTGYGTKYTYDVLGNLLTVTQNAQATSGYQQSRTYTYDFLGRPTSETNPEAGSASHTYDTDVTCGTSSGDQVKRVDAVGNTICYAYDSLHRPISLTYSGPYAGVTPNKYFVYDSSIVNSVTMANGKTRMVEAYTGTTQNGTKITDLGFSYSARGEVADLYESTSNSGGYYHLSQTYWANGTRNQLSGNIATLPTFINGVDGEGRPGSTSASSGQNPVTSTLYNVLGQPYQVNFGSTDSDSFGYDINTGRMTQYRFNVNSQALVGNLTWNANATLQKLIISDPFNSTDSQTCNYVFDDLNRVASANCGSVWSQTFGYDAFGNLTKSGSMSFQPVYTNPTTGQNTNRFISIPGTTVSYDSNGNVLTDGSHVYTWDANGNSMTIDGVGLTYDALDRLVEQNSSGAYSQIAYGSTGEKLALMNGQTLQKAFIPLAGGLSEAVYTPSGLSNYRHKDWLGSARLDSTPARAVSSTTAYGPFGETYAQSGTGDSSFTGQNQDSISGLYDFLYREYSTQGRWPSPDPAGLAAVSLDAPQSWNRYAYVLNNPLSNVDPLGLTCVDSNGEAEEGVSSEKKCDKAGGTWIKPESTSVEVKATPLPNGDTTWDWTVTFATTFFTVPYRKSKEGFVACWNRAASDTLVGLGAPREATPVIETTLGTAGANGLFYSIKSIWAMGNWVRPSSYLAKAAGLGSAGVRAARIAGRTLAVPIAAEVGLRTGAALDCAIPVS